MTVFRTNAAALVASNVAGRVAPARLHPEAMAIDREGRSRLLPGTGGIAVGVHAGDPVDRWVGDHLMPGASGEDASGTPAIAGPLHLLSCVGNRVRDAAGRSIGVVAGKRGGLAPGFWAPQLVGIEIGDEVASRLTPEDRIVVETVGRGMTLTDNPQIVLSNLSLRLLSVLPLVEIDDALSCDVCSLVPPEAARAGLGQDAWVGDLEITDPAIPSGLHFGDLVASIDIDSTVTRFYRPGYISVGIVSHGPGQAPAHGVGVTILLTAPADCLKARIGNGKLGSVLVAWSPEITS